MPKEKLALLSHPFAPPRKGGNYFSVFMRWDCLVQNFPFHCRIKQIALLYLKKLILPCSTFIFYCLLAIKNDTRHETLISSRLHACIFLNKMEGGTKLRTMPARIRLPSLLSALFIWDSFVPKGRTCLRVGSGWVSSRKQETRGEGENTTRTCKRT